MHPKNYLHGDPENYDYDAMGVAGNPVCGDQMFVYLKVRDGKIEEMRWKTYGCASAIASTSVLSELVRGKSAEAALKVDARDIEEALDFLPKHKFHCSVLGMDALRDAVGGVLREVGK